MRQSRWPGHQREGPLASARDAAYDGASAPTARAHFPLFTLRNIVTALRIMVSRHSAFYSPVIAGIANGFFQREGLEPTYAVAPPGKTVAQAIGAGEADVVQSAVSASWTIMEQGREPSMTHFAQINQRDGFFICARNPPPRFDWDQLRNGGFLFVHGGQPQAMLAYAMHLRGTELTQTQPINRGSTKEMMEAFRQGEGEWFHEQAPYPQQLEQEGFGQVVASVGEAIGPVAFSSVAAGREWLSLPEAKQFMRAYRSAREWVNSAPPQNIAAVERSFFPDTDETVLTRSIAAYQQLGTWGGDAHIPRAAYETALDVFAYSNLIRERYAYERVVASPPESL
jgi:NitT/TauT family transport system substrate-binding protein